MSTTITIRVEDDEKERMEAVAENCDMTLSQYARTKLGLRAVRLYRRVKTERKDHVKSNQRS